MSLEESLAKLREGSAKRFPAEVREVIMRTNKELRESGLLDGAIKVGDTLPPFSLQNAHGKTVNSADLLGQ
ncbi:MAG: AhpC/TSA family protein, partial [Alphaproteobacteria bacterium]|nr:AhpC/TSA family protein [Alphaproteobacteria bacterium]